MVNGKFTALALLDLSTAFGTDDHAVLLHRLDRWFGVSAGRALNCSNHTLLTNAVCLEQWSNIEPSTIHRSVPEGSVFGPLPKFLISK